MTDGLERVHIAGFTSLRDVTLEPGRLTVLIGPNGSGKTNLLRALQMIHLMRLGSLQRFVGESGGASALLHYGPKHTEQILFELDFSRPGQRSSYRAGLGFASGDKLLFLSERADSGPTDGGSDRSVSLGVGHFESQLRPRKKDDPAIEAVNKWVSQLRFFHFHDTSMTSALRTHARADDDRALRSDGGNLAAYLARWRKSCSDEGRAAWTRIQELVRRIAPGVKELCPTISEDGNTARLDWIDDRDERFGSHQLSDGTLRAIALITALAQPTSKLPRFMSIDEPELGLHPAAITLLAELARSVSRHAQVLFATQSTAFLDHFEPDEIVVADRVDGATELTRPDPESLRSWLEDYTLSEVFEKGVVGGRP